MENEDKTKEQVISELAEMRQKITELEALEADHKRVEEAFQKQTHDLDKRVKELNSFYTISELVDKPDISLEEILQGTVDLIPSAWQYPEITCARVILEDKIFRTSNFEETIWKQDCEIIVQGNQIGTLEVCYLEEKPESDEGPFLKEERNLINTIVERLGKIIERKQVVEALLESKEKYRSHFENVSDIIYSIDPDYKILNISPSVQRVLGYTPEELIGRPFMDLHILTVESSETALSNIT